MGAAVIDDFRDGYGWCKSCSARDSEPHSPNCLAVSVQPKPTNGTEPVRREEPEPEEEESSGSRQVVFTTADMIKPRRVRWLWQDRLARGTLALQEGRE